MDDLLPAELITKLKDIAGSASDLNPALLARLDERYGIASEYGVSRRRLASYLRKTRQTTTPAARADQPTPSPSANDVWAEKLRAHRARQATVSSILDATFGSLAECSPDLWDRRAYLMLVGLVYERLVTCQAELTTNELVALAKVLSEARRAHVRAEETRHSTAGTDEADGPADILPERVADAVRQVYGTSLPQDASEREESPTRGDAADPDGRPPESQPDAQSDGVGG